MAEPTPPRPSLTEPAVRSSDSVRFSPVTPTDATALLVALVGRPNAGKSSLFNRLTGGSARVGNFPGVTVDVLEAPLALPSGRAARIVDLPGVYSLVASVDPATDEGIAQRFLDDGAAKAGGAVVVVQVLDATQVALGLRLTRELLARSEPLVVVATQADVLVAEGRVLDAHALASALGVEVVLVNARSPEASSPVLAAIARAASAPARAAPALAAPASASASAPARATSCDPDALARAVVRDAAPSPRELHRRGFTARVDALLLHPLLGPVLFLALMTALFAGVFLVTEPVSALLDRAKDALAAAATSLLGKGLLASFVADGIVDGAGTVLTFLPQIVILTVTMELLEASGYLARGAFLLDRVFRIAGLGGRAFVPLLTGHACAIPAIQATRILRDPMERLTTILVIPLMSCAARLPVYGLLIAAFFAGASALARAAIFVTLYFSGIVLGLVAAVVLRRSVLRGRSLPLAMELPAYRAPELRVVFASTLRGAGRFVREVGTTILVAALALWVLLTIPMPGAKADGSALERSIAAGLGRALEPVTEPLGFDWQINVGLIASFGARELMVGTLGVIHGIEDADEDAAPLAARLKDARSADGTRRYGVRTALSLMAFFVLACQCLSTVAAIRRETRSWRWPLFTLGYTYALAWVAAFVVYRGAGLLGLG